MILKIFWRIFANMTWLKAPEVQWHKLGKKGKQKALLDLLDSNPVLNQHQKKVNRYLGEPNELRDLKHRIFESCCGKLNQFKELVTKVESNKLQEIILKLVSDEIIKQHVHKMIADENFEELEREFFRPGRIYYPAQFYIVEFDYYSGQIHYFTEDKVEYMTSVYAEFYDESQDLKDRAEITGDVIKGRRPVLTVDDNFFTKVKTVPCSTNNSQPCVEIQVLCNFRRKGYAKPFFMFTITPKMIKEDGNQFNDVQIIKEKELREVVRILKQKRYV